MIAGRRAGAHAAPPTGSWVLGAQSFLRRRRHVPGAAFQSHPTQRRTARLFPAIVVSITLLYCAPVFAEDPNPLLEISRAELADLLAKSAELDATKRQVTALEASVAALERQVAAQSALIKTQDDMLARQERITGLADEERDVHKGRADRIAKDAAKGNLLLRVQARAGAGALIGAAAAPLFPPAILFGPAVGAIVGLIEHWVVD